MKGIILIILISSGFTYAQSPTFYQEYGGAKTENGYSLDLTSDGGYIAVGRSSSFGNGSADIYLIRTDSFGDTIWTNTYGSVHSDNGSAVQEAYDGGFIVAGHLGKPDTLSENLSEVYVFKTDSEGNTDWTFSWNEGSGDRATSVQLVSDNSYIVTGTLNASINGGNPASFLLKLNIDGDSLWTQIYDTPSIGKSVIQTLDDGYIICGQFGMPPFVIPYIVKTNFSGDTIWTKKGDLGFQFGSAEDIIQTSDSCFILTGVRFDGPSNNAFLSKLDNLGNTIWTKFYGGENDDFTRSIDMDESGGVILAGKTNTFSTGPFANGNIWLIKTDINGDTLWTRSYGGEESEDGFSVKSVNGGGYIVTGTVGGINDIFLLKVDSLGNGLNITSTENSSQIKKSLLHVYPNPTKSKITIELEGIQSNTDSYVSIYDSAGREIQYFDRSDITLSENRFQINVDKLASGLYIVKMELDGSTHVAKFLKF